MSKFTLRTGLIFAALVAVVTAAVAGEAPQAPETKRIGVIFIQQVFKNYDYVKDTETRLVATFKPEQQRIEAEIGRIQEMERALQNNPLKPPNSAAWRKSMMEIESAKLELQTMQEEFAKKVRSEEAAFWNNVYNAFQRSIKILAEYYKYDIIIAAPDIELPEEVLKVMDPLAIQDEILLRRIQYVSPTANLTKSISDLLNGRYKQHQQDPQKNPL